MPDLTTMTALDLLRVEAAREDRYGAGGLLAFHLAGVNDLDVIYKPRPGHRDPSDLLRGVLLLTDGGTRRVDPPLTDADLDALPLVGAPVYAEDRDNLADWLTVAHRWLEVRQVFRQRYNVYSAEPRSIITPFLAAGRGPSYVRRILDSSAQHVVPPHAYGFDLSAEEWDRLASAGVTDRAALAGYEAAGCTMTEAVDFAAKGVPPGAAVLLHREGVPMTSWVDRAAGIREEWVPYGPATDYGDSRHRDPAADGVIGRSGGHTIDDLKRYADAGWTTGLYDFGDNGLYFGHGRRSGGRITLDRRLCNALVDAGLTPDDLKRWANAVTVQSAGSRSDADWVPSLFGFAWKNDMLTDVIRLHEAGVRPSHINDYRYAGCRSADDVLRCVAAGITGTRVAYLRKTYAVPRNQWDKTCRMTLQELLAAHDTDKQREAAS